MSKTSPLVWGVGGDSGGEETAVCKPGKKGERGWGF